MVNSLDEYASDEGVLRYIDDCGAIEPHPSQVTVKFDNISETLAFLWFVAQSLKSTKAEFVQQVREQKSSSAHSSAEVFKILLSLQADTLAIAKEYGAGRWSERSIAELPTYPDNVR